MVWNKILLVLGLTGSIGMGKTTVSQMFKRQGVPVHDSDKIVHQLFVKNQKIILEIKKQFPIAIKKNIINRQVLAKEVIGNIHKLQILEEILHPLIRLSEKKFVIDHMIHRHHMVVLDIPLLYETNAEKRCDAVIVVSAPKFVQEARVLRRLHMTQQNFKFFKSRQTPDNVKRQRADFIIETGLGFAFSLRKVKKIIQVVKQGKDKS